VDPARLQRLREALGFSQRELAAEFGVAHGAVGLWETGERPIPGPVRRLLEIYEAELGIAAAPAGGSAKAAFLPTRPAARAARLPVALAKATAGAIFTRPRAPRAGLVVRIQQAIAREVVATAGDMKGLAMKIAQIPGYLDFGEADGVRARVSASPIRSRAMPPSLVAAVFMEELGRGPRRVFAEWSSEPLAAASIGQVHRARLPDGRWVAVKVQYPRIVDALEADLGTVDVIRRACGLVYRGSDLGPVVDELRTRFLEECDYVQEAGNQETFRRLWSGRAGVEIPAVVGGLSTRRILVTEMAGGEPLDAFATRATQAARNRAGELLFDFAFESLFRHGIFNADPHPGNYLFGDDRVTFIDFGCVKRLSPEYVATFKALARAILEGDRGRLESLGLALGIVRDPRRFDFDAQWRLSLSLYDLYLRDRAQAWTPEYLARTWRMTWVDNPNRFQTNIPAEWVFLSRFQWGMFAVLAKLRAAVNWRRRLLDLVYEPGEPRPAPYDDRGGLQ
jgi:transcriptional regulator with XRE-family HTH domain